MTQDDFGFPPATIPQKGIGWTRYPGICRANYEMTVDGVPNGVWIREAGHPTALRPYYVCIPASDGDGHIILARKFAKLEEAKGAAIAELSRSAP